MPNRKSPIISVAAAILVLMMFGAAERAAAQQETVLHNFHDNGKDGVDPKAGLVFDTAGNLYGAAFEDGPHNDGVVFELTPDAGGSWTERILHAFGSGEDGQLPVASLTFDAAGNLYGTTAAGGVYGAGTVFELSPQANGSWKEKILHAFNPNHGDGNGPDCVLIFDASGNLYGTTYGGGAYGGEYNGGTVFELSPKAGGIWKESILHDFNPNTTDGFVPSGGVILDSAGNLYGTTYYGGVYNDCDGAGCGMAFELTPKASGSWVERAVHNFQNDGTDGYGPAGSLVIDGAGNLYGATQQGGEYAIPSEGGVVFELTPAAGGMWTETILHTFDPNGTDGTIADSNLIFDAAGNLYGTTIAGGGGGEGVLYELTPTGGGIWTEKILHHFPDGTTDGAEPLGGVILDAAGNLYGATYSGGLYPYSGMVYEVTP